jgi:hypothetical protein
VLYSIRNKHPNKIRQTLYVVVRHNELIIQVANYQSIIAMV